jgi:hypothetical protein
MATPSVGLNWPRSSVSVDKASNTITIVISLPLPTVSLPTISFGFPPKLPLLKVPLIPEALRAIAKTLAQLQKIIEKLLSLIPRAAIRLIVKVGPIVVIDQTFTTADALAATIALTLCNKSNK